MAEDVQVSERDLVDLKELERRRAHYAVRHGHDDEGRAFVRCRCATGMECRVLPLLDDIDALLALTRDVEREAEAAVVAVQQLIILGDDHVKALRALERLEKTAVAKAGKP